MGRHERNKHRDADTLLRTCMQAANSFARVRTNQPNEPQPTRHLLGGGDEAADVLAVLNRAGHLKASSEEMLRYPEEKCSGIFDELREIGGGQFCILKVRRFDADPGRRTRACIYDVEFCWPLADLANHSGALKEQLEQAGLLNIRKALSGGKLKPSPEIVERMRASAHRKEQSRFRSETSPQPAAAKGGGNRSRG